MTKNRIMNKISLLITLPLLAALASNCGDPELKKLRENAKTTFGTLPAVEKASGARAKQVALGKKLYFDKRLSVNDQQSCNSCHLLGDGKAGVDNLPTSPGAIKGKKGTRNSPTVLNAKFHIAQFWDGRAKDLVEQAKGPILNPVEMAMPSEKATVKKLSAVKEYPAMFDEAFPKAKVKGVTYNKIAAAIARFEETLVTTDRFDAFLKGDDKALNETEREGLKLFMDTGCTTCHNGNLLGGKMYQKMGLVKPYKNQKDQGRFEVTKNEADKMMFKVPALRNVALTAPYFHDGQTKTLKEAIKIMADIQLGKQLTDDQVAKIEAFLKALNNTRKFDI